MPRDIADQLLGDIRSKLHVSNPELNAVLTDKFLIRCFRCCHYDEAATIKLVENYEKTLEHLAPLRTRYQLLDLIESGIFKVLATTGLHNERILYFDLAKWKPRSILFKHVCTSLAIVLDYLMLDERAEKDGIILLMNFENFGLNRLFNIKKPFLTKFIKVIDGHLPFYIKKVLVINLNLTGKFFWSSVIHFFSKDFIDKLKLYSKDVKDIGNYIDERLLNVQFTQSEGKPMEIDFKHDFANKAFTFFGYKYEENM